MKNKKGFTLVELLAVIVILALITGIAVIGIGQVISRARTDIMWENAQSIINGVRQTIALNNEAAEGRSYGFDASLFESGGIKSSDNASFSYRSMTTSPTNPTNSDVPITTGLWRIVVDAPTTCNTNTKSYISVDANGIYTLCLVSDDGKVIYGTQDQINTRSTVTPTP